MSLGGDDLSTSLCRKRRTSVMSMEDGATTSLPKDSPVEICAVHSGRVNSNDTRAVVFVRTRSRDVPVGILERYYS